MARVTRACTAGSRNRRPTLLPYSHHTREMAPHSSPDNTCRNSYLHLSKLLLSWLSGTDVDFSARLKFYLVQDGGVRILSMARPTPLPYPHASSHMRYGPLHSYPDHIGKLSYLSKLLLYFPGFLVRAKVFSAKRLNFLFGAGWGRWGGPGAAGVPERQHRLPLIAQPQQPAHCAQQELHLLIRR